MTINAAGVRCGRHDCIRKSMDRVGKKERSFEMNLNDLFPNLTDDNHEITSPRTIEYNCIAWAARNTKRWWQPGAFWPIESTRDDCGIGELVLAFKKP